MSILQLCKTIFACSYNSRSKEDVKHKALILREAETSHKEELEDMYDKHTLRPEKVRVFLDDNDIPIYGMIIYIIDYRDGRTSRYACGEYYPISNKTLMPHPFQGSICW